MSNNKGGAGKTTTVLNLAAAIARKGYHVLVIDTDPQCNLSLSVGWDTTREGTRTKPGEPTIFNAICLGQNIPVYRNETGLYYTPSSPRMEDADIHLNSSEVTDPVRVLKMLFAEPIDDHTGEGLKEWESSFDFIFIDTQPAMSRVTVNVICAATGIIIPVELEPLAVDGYVKTIGKIMKIKKVSNPSLQIHGILLTKKDRRLVSARSFEEQLREEGDVFETTISGTTTNGPVSVTTSSATKKAEDVPRKISPTLPKSISRSGESNTTARPCNCITAIICNHLTT